MAVKKIFGAVGLTNGANSLNKISYTVIGTNDLAIARGNFDTGQGGGGNQTVQEPLISTIGNYSIANVNGTLVDGFYDNGGLGYVTTTNGGGTGCKVSVTITGGGTAFTFGIIQYGSGYLVGNSISIQESLDFSSLDTGTLSATVTALNEDTQGDSIFFYRYDANSGATEDLPRVVRPSNTVLSGRWFLISPTYFMENVIVEAGKKIVVNEIVGNGSGLSLNYNDNSLDIQIGTSNVTVYKPLVVSQQVFSGVVGTFVTGNAPFVISSSKKVDMLNADYLDDKSITDIALRDGSQAFTGVVGGVYPTADAHLATKEYVDDQLGSRDEHSELIGNVWVDDIIGGTLVDDHIQYIRTDGARAFTGAVAGVYPTATTHLTTVQYVTDIRNSIESGIGIQNYVRKDGTTAIGGDIAPYKALYYYQDSGILPTKSVPIVDDYEIVPKWYVDDSLSTHNISGHVGVFVRTIGDSMSGRISYTGVPDSADNRYLLSRHEVDNIVEGIYTSLSGADDYDRAYGADVPCNLVRKNYPTSRWDYTISDVDNDYKNLVTYGYLYRYLGDVIEGNSTVGFVVGIKLNTSGTSGYVTGNYTINSPTGGTNQIISVVAESGVIVSVTQVNTGTGFSDGATYTIPGGTGGSIITWISKGITHDSLRESSLGDDHTQYSHIDGHRAYTGVVRGVTPAIWSDLVTAGTTDSIVTAAWVYGYVSAGGGSITHDTLPGVDVSTAHLNYPLLNGTRDFTAGVGYSNGTIVGSAGMNDFATKQYVVDSISGVGSIYVTSDGTTLITGHQYVNYELNYNRPGIVAAVFDIGTIDGGGGVLTGSFTSLGTNYYPGQILDRWMGSAIGVGLEIEVTSINGTGGITGYTILSAGSGYLATENLTHITNDYVLAHKDYVDDLAGQVLITDSDYSFKVLSDCFTPSVFSNNLIATYNDGSSTGIKIQGHYAPGNGGQRLKLEMIPPGTLSISSINSVYNTNPLFPAVLYTHTHDLDLTGMIDSTTQVSGNINSTFPGGLKLHSGIANGTGTIPATTTISITFTVPYSATPNVFTDLTGNQSGLSVTNITSTGFDLTNSNAFSLSGVRWFAIGV